MNSLASVAKVMFPPPLDAEAKIKIKHDQLNRREHAKGASESKVNSTSEEQAHHE